MELLPERLEHVHSLRAGIRLLVRLRQGLHARRGLEEDLHTLGPGKLAKRVGGATADLGDKAPILRIVPRFGLFDLDSQVRGSLALNFERLNKIHCRDKISFAFMIAAVSSPACFSRAAHSFAFQALFFGQNVLREQQVALRKREKEVARQEAFAHSRL